MTFCRRQYWSATLALGILAIASSCESTAKFRPIGSGFSNRHDLPPPDDARHVRDGFVLTIDSPILDDEEFLEELTEDFVKASADRLRIVEDPDQTPQFEFLIEQLAPEDYRTSARIDAVTAPLHPERATDVWAFRVTLRHHTNEVGLTELRNAFEFNAGDEPPPPPDPAMPDGEVLIQVDLRTNPLHDETGVWEQTRYFGVAVRRGLSDDSDAGAHAAVRERVLARLPGWLSLP